MATDDSTRTDDKSAPEVAAQPDKEGPRDPVPAPGSAAAAAPSKQPKIATPQPLATVGPRKLRTQPPLQAVLLIHGIGRQQPFETLDNFVRHLCQTFESDGSETTITHSILGAEEAFDHRLTVAPANLDIYEFSWASLTKHRASFADIARWLSITSLTPLGRFAFNLPLITRRASRKAIPDHLAPMWLRGLFSFQRLVKAAAV